MKATRWLLTLVACHMLSGNCPAAESLHWHSDLEVAKREAAQTNRLVLVHFGAPWCGPCMRLEREVFSQPGFGAELTDWYVPVKLNLDNAPQTARQYGVTSIPADVVITPQGKLIRKLQSPPDAARYVGQLAQVAAAQREAGPAQDAGQRYAGAAPVTQPTAEQVATQPATTPAAAQPTATQPAAPPSRSTSADDIGRAFSASRAAVPAAAPTGQQHAGQQHIEQQPVEQPPVEQPPSGDRYADFFNRRAAETVAATPPAPAAPPRARQTTTTWSHEPMDPNSPLVRQAANNESPAPPTPENLVYEAHEPIAAPTGPAYRNQVEQPRQHVASSAGYGRPNAPIAAAPVVPPGNPPLGLEGYCPVHLSNSQEWVRGDAKWGAIHRGRTYLFVTQACQQKFLTDPDRFSPVLQGSDPVIAVEENKLVDGRREFGVFFNGRVYLFAAAATRDRFEQDPNRYAAVGQQR